MKTIKGDLILTEDTTFDESIKVEGNIKGYFDLKVIGNIDCRNIDCWNINCGNIDCKDIDCGNIDAWNINAGNIVCCDKIKVKLKVKCRYLIKDRFSVKAKEWELK